MILKIYVHFFKEIYIKIIWLCLLDQYDFFNDDLHIYLKLNDLDHPNRIRNGLTNPKLDEYKGLDTCQFYEDMYVGIFWTLILSCNVIFYHKMLLTFRNVFQIK